MISYVVMWREKMWHSAVYATIKAVFITECVVQCQCDTVQNPIKINANKFLICHTKRHPLCEHGIFSSIAFDNPAWVRIKDECEFKCWQKMNKYESIPHRAMRLVPRSEKLLNGSESWKIKRIARFCGINVESKSDQSALIQYAKTYVSMAYPQRKKKTDRFASHPTNKYWLQYHPLKVSTTLVTRLNKHQWEIRIVYIRCDIWRFFVRASSLVSLV